MQVSGNLFHLPTDTKVVPLPWFCRAPLGLKSGTSVHVALVESSQRPIADVPPQGQALVPVRTADATALNVDLYRPPDLLVSVLDPRAWDSTYLLEAFSLDGPGLLHRLLKAIANANQEEKHLNVVIGESFTVPIGDCGDRRMRNHRTTLYCQLQQGAVSKKRLDDLVRVLNRTKPGRPELTCKLAPKAAGLLAKYLGQIEVKDGLVRLDEDWRGQARDLFRRGLEQDRIERAAAIANQFDFDLASALADLESRAIRLTFPLRGACRLRTRHTDEPNTAVQVTQRLEPGHSILGGLVAKADAGSGELSAVCEPMPGTPPLPPFPFPDLQNSTEFRRLKTVGPQHFEDAVFPELPPNELSRQLKKFAIPYGREASELVAELTEGIRAESIPKASSLPICAGCVPVFAHRHRAALDCLSAAVRTFRLDDRGNVDVQCASSAMFRIVRMLTADIAFFVLWSGLRGNTSPAESVALTHAILYSQLGKGRGLLLVESDSMIPSAAFPPLASMLAGRVDTRLFSWRQEHADAFEQLKRDPTAAVPSVLDDPDCLGNQIMDWMYGNALLPT